jgi:hypothetical protein
MGVPLYRAGAPALIHVRADVWGVRPRFGYMPAPADRQDVPCKRRLHARATTVPPVGGWAHLAPAGPGRARGASGAADARGAELGQLLDVADRAEATAGRYSSSVHSTLAGCAALLGAGANITPVAAEAPAVLISDLHVELLIGMRTGRWRAPI